LKNNNKNIRLLVDCHVFDGKPQGTTTYLKGIYSELIKEKSIDFYFVASDAENLKKVFGTQKNIYFIPLYFNNKFLRLLIEYPYLIKKHKIDFAHFQYIVPPLKLCKYIITIHDVLFIDYPKYFPFWYRIKNRILFQVSSYISDINLTVSEYSKEQIQMHFKVKNIYVTPNAVEDKYFDSFNREQLKDQVLKKYNLKDYFLFVSRREPRKNHLNLLKVFFLYNYYQEYQLVFVGNQDIIDDEYVKFYSNLDLKVKERILYFDKLNENELLTITRGATVSIYPSYAEGFGIPPLESIACGVPTICSNTTAMKDFDFIEDYLFDPNSLHDLNDKILKSIHNNISSEIPNRMKLKYSWNKSARILYNLIKNND